MCLLHKLCDGFILDFIRSLSQGLLRVLGDSCWSLALSYDGIVLIDPDEDLADTAVTDILE